MLELLQKAREIVAKFDERFILINSLAIFDTGIQTGYVATFQFTETLADAEHFEEFYRIAPTLARTGKSKSCAEAIQIAIAKCEAELESLVTSYCRVCKSTKDLGHPIGENEFICDSCALEMEKWLLEAHFTDEKPPVSIGQIQETLTV